MWDDARDVEFLRGNEKLVFVCGCPRSGTSVTAWALAQHPAFVTSVESHFLYHFFAAADFSAIWEKLVKAQGYVVAHGLSRESFFRMVGRGFLSVFDLAATGQRFVDQSPENIIIAEKLAELFPKAKFVQIVRSARSVVASMLNSNFSEPWASDLECAANTWNFFVEKGLEAKELLADRMLVVPHETLERNPELVCDGLFRFLDEPYHPSPAAFLRKERINSSFSKERAKEGFPGDLPPRGPWESWPEHLKERVIELTDAVQRRVDSCKPVWLQEITELAQEALVIPSAP